MKRKMIKQAAALAMISLVGLPLMTGTTAHLAGLKDSAESDFMHGVYAACIIFSMIGALVTLFAGARAFDILVNAPEEVENDE